MLECLECEWTGAEDPGTCPACGRAHLAEADEDPGDPEGDG